MLRVVWVMLGEVGDRGATGDRGDMGLRGLQGYHFTPSRVGWDRDRLKYGGSALPFSYLSVDKGELYFLLSANTWSSGIPLSRGDKGEKGDKGDRGEKGDKGILGDEGRSFQAPNRADYKDRVLYDSQVEGTSFFALDSSLLYFRITATPGTWTEGIPFGRGDQGESFRIDGYGMYSELSSYDSEVTGFTFYALDVGQVYIKTYRGWGPGIDINREVGRSFLVDTVGLSSDLVKHTGLGEGFTYYAEDSGRVYFKKAGSGWTDGFPFLKRGSSFKIDASGSFLGRGGYDGEGLGFCYYATDRGEVYFRVSGGGVWSRGYPFGTALPFSVPGRVFIFGTALQGLQPMSVTGDVLLSELGEADLVDHRIEVGHYKDLTTDVRTQGTIYVWDTLSVSWEAVSASRLFRYGLLDPVGLYYDAANKRLGVGKKSPLVSFDISGQVKLDTLEVNAGGYFDVRGSAVFNEGGVDKDFRIEGVGSSHLVYMDANLGRFGVGRATPVTTLDIDGGAIFNSGRSSLGDFSVSGQTLRLIEVSSRFDRVGIGTTTPAEVFSVDVSSLFNQGSGDHDFRVSGQSDDHVLYVQASSDRVGIGTDVPLTMLSVYGSGSFNAGGGDYDFRVDGQSVRNVLYVDASEGRLGVGTSVPVAGFSVSGGTLFNQTRGNYDFQIKGGIQPNLLFVDASENRLGMGTNSPVVLLDVREDGVFNHDEGGHNFRVSGSSESHLFFVDGSLSRVGVRASVPGAMLDVRGGAIFNEDGGDYDFRVDGDRVANLLYVDASEDRLGVGTGLPSSFLDVRGSAIFNGGVSNADFRVEGDGLEYLFFVDASESRLGINTDVPGVFFDVRGDAVFNEDGGDHDFRIHSDTARHMFFVDASLDYVGVGVDVPSAKLSVGGSGVFNSGGGDYDFRVEGDSESHLLYVDGGLNRLGVGTSKLYALLDMDGDAVFNEAGEDYDFLVEGEMVRHMIYIDGFKNAVGISDSTLGSTLTVGRSGLFNKGLGDYDFRVEGQGVSQLFFLDGGLLRVGVGTGVPVAGLDVRGAAIFNKDDATLVGMRSGNDFKIYGQGVVGELFFVDADLNRVGVGTSSPGVFFGVNGSAVFNEGGSSADFRVSGVTEGELLYIDGGRNRLGIKEGGPSVFFDVEGSAVFNSGLGNYDFRVASVGVSDQLFVDASADRVGIGTNAPNALLDVRGAAIFNVDRGNHIFRVSGRTQDHMLSIPSTGSRLGVNKSADGSVIFSVNGQASFNRGQSGSADFRVASRNLDRMLFLDVNASTDGGVLIGGTSTSTVSEALRVLKGSVFNEGGLSTDFRVDGDSDSHLLFVDGSADRVGVGTSSPTKTLEVSGDAKFNSTNADVDFIIRGQSESHLFFVNADKNFVGIGTGDPWAALHVKGGTQNFGFYKAYPNFIATTTYGDATLAVASSNYNTTYSGNSNHGYWNRISAVKTRPLTGSCLNFVNCTTFDQDLDQDNSANSSRKDFVARFDGSVVLQKGSTMIATNSNIVVSSDRRIKRDVLSVDRAASIEKLERLRLVRYRMRDEFLGGDMRLGLLAQEAEAVDSSWVSRGVGFIPDLYTPARMEVRGASGVVLEVSGSSLDTLVHLGDKVRVYATDTLHREDIALDMRLLKIEELGSGMFRFHLTLFDSGLAEDLGRIDSMVFLYGREVDDLLTVSYRDIYLLNVEATQHLMDRGSDYEAFMEGESVRGLDQVEFLEGRVDALRRSVERLMGSRGR